MRYCRPIRYVQTQAMAERDGASRTEETIPMGKLVEKLEQVGQASGGGMGFLGRVQAQARAARPAAVLVTLRASDSAAAKAAAQNGVDGVIVVGWKPGSDVRALASALETSGAVWGVELADDLQRTDGMLAAVREAGGAFAMVAPTAPARILLEEAEKLDVVVMVDPPKDDLSRLLMRADNLLPAQVALLRARFTNAELAEMRVEDFARLRLVFEGLRFPTLVSLREAPAAEHVRLLVRMGSDGLVLPGEGRGADAVGSDVRALREELERTPARPESGSTVAIGGLMTAHEPQLPQPGRREPEPEPEHE
jgi:hypothetical protein